MADARSRRNEPEPVGPIRSRRRGTNGAAVQGIENPGRLRRRRPLSFPVEWSITDVARETERRTSRQAARQEGQKGLSRISWATIAFYGPDNRMATKAAV